LETSGWHTAVEHITWNSHSFSNATIRPLIKTFPWLFKFGKKLDRQYAQVALQHVRLVTEKPTICTEALLKRLVVLCGIRGEKSECWAV
jgi:hypothetical protein